MRTVEINAMDWVSKPMNLGHCCRSVVIIWLWMQVAIMFSAGLLGCQGLFVCLFVCLSVCLFVRNQRNKQTNWSHSVLQCTLHALGRAITTSRYRANQQGIAFATHKGPRTRKRQKRHFRHLFALFRFPVVFCQIASPWCLLLAVQRGVVLQYNLDGATWGFVVCLFVCWLVASVLCLCLPL